MRRDVKNRRRVGKSNRRVFLFKNEQDARIFVADVNERLCGACEGYRLRLGRFVEVGDLYAAEVSDVEAEAAAYGGKVVCKGSFFDAVGSKAVNVGRYLTAELERQYGEEERGA